MPATAAASRVCHVVVDLVGWHHAGDGLQPLLRLSNLGGGLLSIQLVGLGIAKGLGLRECNARQMIITQLQAHSIG
jgi:hypothetical protein